MVLLGLLPVLEAMVNIFLIQVKTGESLGVIPITRTINIDREAVYKRALINSSETVKEELKCQPGEYLHPDGTHCCNLCHIGTYVSQYCLSGGRTNCTPCPRGQYLDAINYSTKCQQCSQCRHTLNQIVISECTPEHDIVCGCGKNQYRDGISTVFSCKNCSTCQDGKIVQRECTEFQDTECTCQLGYFLNKTRCLPCSSCNKEECKMGDCKLVLHLLPRPPESSQLTLVLGVLVVILAAGCALLLARKIIKQSYLKRICSYSCLYPGLHQEETKHQKPEQAAPSQESTTKLSTKTPDKASDCLLDSSKKMNLYPQKATSVSLPVQDVSCMLSSREMPIPDSPELLYTVVDHIPFTRWREFIRRLGLKENVIERIYVEQHGRREAQYEMLKQWRLQAGRGATLDSITTVLNIMDLNGCAEDIQDALIQFL